MVAEISVIYSLALQIGRRNRGEQCMSRSDISIARDSGGAAGSAPVWVLASYRAGENTQLLGLAEALGMPFQYLQFRYRPWAGLLGLLRRSSRAGVHADDRQRLGAPWPVLVIAAGLRNEPLCAYIRRASGGRTRVVFLGRTWCRPERFDLLITTPQYRVRPDARVLVNLLTQHRVTAGRLAAAAVQQQALFRHLPRPWIGVLLGGSSGPYVLGTKSARLLREQLQSLRAREGGSLLISSSARTPESFFRELTEELEANHFCYRWRPDDPDNPYYAMLALADVLVVTGDSVAMLSEAAATDKPVLIFDIPTAGKADVTPAACWYRWMMRWLPERLTRDVGLFHRQFVAAGYGAFLAAAAEGEVVNGLGAPLHAAERATATTRARVVALLESEHLSVAAQTPCPAAPAVEAVPDGAASPTRPRSIR